MSCLTLALFGLTFILALAGFFFPPLWFFAFFALLCALLMWHMSRLEARRRNGAG